jgi:hypothetical protein
VVEACEGREGLVFGYAVGKPGEQPVKADDTRRVVGVLFGVAFSPNFLCFVRRAISNIGVVRCIVGTGQNRDEINSTAGLFFACYFIGAMRSLFLIGKGKDAVTTKDKSSDFFNA